MDDDAAMAMAMQAEDEVMTYEKAEELTKANEIESAIDAWAALLQSAVDQYGEMGIETAQLYYRYGDALLRKAEESDDVFGDGMAQNGEEKKEEVGHLPLDDDEIIPQQPKNKEENTEMDDDVAVAFEVLEVARLIWQRESKGIEEAKALCRLGDLQKVNGNFGTAVRDYEKCLDMRAAVLPVTDRRIADAHWCLATALDFHVSEDSCVDKTATKAKALEHYRNCANSLADRAKNLDKADPEWKELDSILEELKETIAAAEDVQKAARQKQLNDYAALLAAKSKPLATSSSATNVNTLQPKRKKIHTLTENSTSEPEKITQKRIRPSTDLSENKLKPSASSSSPAPPPSAPNSGS